MIDVNAYLTEVIAISIIIAGVIALVWGLKHFKIPVPFIGAKVEYFSYTLIDEGRNEVYQKIKVTELKRLGNKVYFRLSHGIYLVMRDRITRRAGLPYSRYLIGDSTPLPIKNNDTSVTSANENKEMADSKVVFDLLRFTLSNVETLFLMVALAAVAVGVIDLYYVYSLGSQLGNLNTNLNIIIRYLYPNGLPKA